MSNMDDSTLAFLLTHELQQAFQRWDASMPARTGLHAYSLLESESDWCTRQHVLAHIAPEQRQQKDQHWRVLAMFLNGWTIHRKWQHELLKRSGIVAIGIDHHGTQDFELDLTHNEQGIRFSPDAIIKYGGQVMPVEIKGINTLDFQGCPDLYERVFAPKGSAYTYEYKLVQEARPGLVGATLAEAMHRNKSIRTAVPQLNLYLHLLKLEKGIILVEDKNTQDFLLWVHTYDPDLVTLPLARAVDVQMSTIVARDRQELPERICKTVNDSRAKRCPFRGKCFKEERV